MKINKTIILLIGLVMCSLAVNAIDLVTWNIAPYNIGIGNLYRVTEDVKVIKQRISYGDCVYPDFIEVPLVYGDYESYEVSKRKDQITIKLKPNARRVQVFMWANSKTHCAVGTKYIIDRGWLNLHKRTINFKYDYKTEWIEYITK